jgi:hypothetical protein
MNTDVEERQNGHGDANDIGEESQEQLDAVARKLSTLSRKDGSLVSMSKQDLSLLKQMLMAASEEYKEQVMWRMCDFIDEDEAMDHVNAYYEAKELGMDTGQNVAYMYALCSANRNTNHSNLMSQLLSAMQYGKWTGNNNTKGKSNDNANPRSPLSS